MEKVTIRELGRRFKKGNPDHSHIPDVEVGQEIVLRYPQYLDSIDLEDNDLEAMIQGLMDKAKRVHGGWFSSWLGKKHATRRAEWYYQLLAESQTIRALALEQDALNETRYQRTQRPIVRNQEEAERNATHDVSLNIAQYAGELAKQGYTLETDQQIKLKEVDSRIKIGETEQIHRLEEAHRKILDHQEVEKTALLKMDELRRVFILKHFTDHQKFAMLQTALDDNYRDIARLEREKKDGWEYMVADRKENIVTLKENQNVLRTRLLQAAPEEIVGGIDPDADRPRDPR